MIALLPLLLTTLQTAAADEVPDWLSEDDDASAAIQVEQHPLWPHDVRIDTRDGIISVNWFDDGRPPDWYAIEDLQQFERARPYEGHPDELFIVISDGTRLLVTRGADVQTQAIVAPALANRPLVVLPPGQGHLTPAAMATLPGPTLAIGSLGGGTAITALSPSALNAPPDGPSSATIDRDRSPPHDLDLSKQGGVISRAQIDTQLRQRTALFSRCYQQGLQRKPDLHGTLRLQFIIDLDGSVAGAWVDDSTLNDAAVEHCILEEIRQARFPSPQGGTALVGYPLRF